MNEKFHYRFGFVLPPIRNDFCVYKLTLSHLAGITDAPHFMSNENKTKIEKGNWNERTNDAR